MHPAIAIDGVEQSSVEERDLGVEAAVVIIIVAAVYAECLVEEWL